MSTQDPPSQGEPRSPTRPPTGAHPVAAARARIMLVDDNPASLDALDARLRGLGYLTTVVQDAVTAVDAVRADAPDLVVLDVVMPELNGYQACREIKAIDPAIPVVMLSDRDEPADRFWAQQCGAEAFVARPIDAAAVVLRISALLGAT
ncbi:MAG: response regulator [Polyangiales bacterium]